MVVLRYVSFVILSLPIILALESRPCYRIDGSFNDYSYKGFGGFFPCNPDQKVSHCCYGRDICIDNGLCMGFGSSQGADRAFTLAGCTDAAWPSPCPQYFVSNRHEVLNGSRRLLIWSCTPYNFGEYCIGSEKFEFSAACCADESLRIKTIPLQKSMHMAMDPTQKIVMFADDDIPGSPNDGNANEGTSNNTSDIVLGVLAILAAVVFGFCQWQFPKTRIRLSWITRRRTRTQQAHARHVEAAADPPEIPGSFRDENDTIDPEAQGSAPSESYSDSISNVLEIEDGWRNP